jgi:non-ribosomal peptide synthetase component E (peptide arylation enzyme)
MLVGYLHPDDEDGVFDPEGYYRTGDLGRWVDGAYLAVSGRAKDIIIRNGENISPKEIEDILVAHPDVGEVAIVGLPNARTGETACAFIVPKQGPGPDVPSLCRFLAAKGVAAFKFPERVVIRPDLPKNEAGKVLKHRLREALIAASVGQEV